MGLVRLALNLLLGVPLLLLASLCAAAGMGAHLGRTSLDFDLLAHFAPVWLAGALACVIVGLLTLRGLAQIVIVGIAAGGVVAAGSLIAPELTRSTGPTAAADAPGRIKLVQFNVWAHNRNNVETVDWLEREDPDIAVLEETTPPLRELIRERGRWRIVCPNCEVMVLSRAAPIAVGGPATPPAQGPLTRATFRDAQGDFTIIGVHYAWPTDGGDQQAQEARLAEAIAATPRRRTIVVGDFNSTPWSYARRRWDEVFGLVRRDRALFTWPARQSTRMRWLSLVPFLPIDHVYAGRGWATVDVHRGPKLGSDHYPVVVTLAPVAPH